MGGLNERYQQLQEQAQRLRRQDTKLRSEKQELRKIAEAHKSLRSNITTRQTKSAAKSLVSHPE